MNEGGRRPLRLFSGPLPLPLTLLGSCSGLSALFCKGLKSLVNPLIPFLSLLEGFCFKRTSQAVPVVLEECGDYRCSLKLFGNPHERAAYYKWSRVLIQDS